MTTIVIMPGGFHPFHAGHLALYQSAQRAFPDADVYVAATNDTSARPFPFPVKEKLAKLAGVEAGHFVQVKSPFRAEEITAKFDPARDTLIFVRSEKDSTKPPQPGGVKKDGSASYLQPLLGAKKLEPFARHAYMAYLPTVEFGPGMTSATEIRTAWPQLNEKRKTALVMSLYPRTRGNAKLAATVVKLLDAAIGTQDVAEGLDEAVGGNYLYHATSAGGLKGMLSSGSIRSATGPQAATSAQTTLPTVSVTRDWGYASGAQAQSQLGGIGRDAILVLDRNAVESNFKTLGTSQSTNIKGLAFNPYLKKDGAARSQNTDPMARTNAKAKAKYAEPTAKAGGEFEEAVVVPKGALPLKGTMVGFWVNPKSELMQDPSIMNDPRRLDMPRPNQFVKAAQQQGVAEGAPIVVALAPIDVRNPKKAAQPYRNQGDIVPDTKPPSTEKRGVKGRPGQRPMPKYDESASETSKQKGVVGREYDRDPELRQALLYAKQHYPQHANDPEQAMLKWLQRGLKHSEQEDRQHDRRLAQLNSKVSALIASITQLKQQQNQIATENNDYMDE